MKSKGQYRSPKKVFCPRCYGQLEIMSCWLPPPGFDRDLRKYGHNDDDWALLCGQEQYVITSLKGAPAGVR